MADAQRLESVPSTAALYPRAVAASLRPALRRVPGVGSALAGVGDALPDAELSLAAVELDRDNLIAYDRVCGFRLGDALPPTYLHLVAFPLALRIMTRSDFPFPVIGLVHVRNRIEAIRSVDVSERPAISVRAEDLTPHPRGKQFELVAEATIDAEPVWRSSSTYLRRGNGSSGEGRREQPPEPREPSAVWKVPGDIGRRYAAVSGDTNPIHLHPLTARLLGMPRPIAHGMWLKARCLAALEASLPDAYEVDVSFKLPLQLPARIGFAAWREAAGHGFALQGWSSGKPHLTGEVRPLS